MLLHLAMRLFSGQRMALGSELADIRLHQAGICDPIGHGDHSCDDCEAEERSVGCCVRLSGDPQVATQKVAEDDAICDQVCKCCEDGEDELGRFRQQHHHDRLQVRTSLAHQDD